MTIVYLLIAMVVFGLLIAIHEFGHFIAAKWCGVPVLEFSIGMGPCLWSKTYKETQYSLRALPFGGYCAMEGEDSDSEHEQSLRKQSFWKQLLVFICGPIMNLLAGFLILLVIYSSATGFYTPKIMGFAPEFSMGQEGLQVGDTILEIDDERVYLYSDISLLLQLNTESVFDLKVRRGNETVVLQDLPLEKRVYTAVDGETQYTGYGLFFGEVEEATWSKKIQKSFLHTLDLARVVRLSLEMLVTGKSGIEDMSGPVGIVSTMTEIGAQSATLRIAAENLASFAALLAVNLGVMNLLPIPALDGGRVFFLLINQISQFCFKKKVPEQYEMMVNMAGLILLLGFMVLVTFQDVFRLFR